MCRQAACETSVHVEAPTQQTDHPVWLASGESTCGVSPWTSTFLSCRGLQPSPPEARSKAGHIWSGTKPCGCGTWLPDLSWLVYVCGILPHTAKSGAQHPWSQPRWPGDLWGPQRLSFEDKGLLLQFCARWRLRAGTQRLWHLGGNTVHSQCWGASRHPTSAWLSLF